MEGTSANRVSICEQSKNEGGPDTNLEIIWGAPFSHHLDSGMMVSLLIPLDISWGIFLAGDLVGSRSKMCDGNL